MLDEAESGVVAAGGRNAMGGDCDAVGLLEGGVGIARRVVRELRVLERARWI